MNRLASSARELQACHIKTACRRARAASSLFPALVLLANPTNGQESEGYTSGALTFIPRLALRAVQNDNIYTIPADAIGSFIFIQAPELLLRIDPGQHRLELEYAGEFGQYSEDSDDDFADHRFRAAALLDLNTRHKLDISGDLIEGHEDRGSGLTRSEAPTDDGFPQKPDEYSDRLANISYRFGADDATGRIELDLGARKREYNNNRDRTAFFDRSQDIAAAAFYYRFRPGTYLVFDLQRKDVVYEEQRPGEAGRDGQELRLRAGLTWEPTGKTRGRVSVGQVRKEFDDRARPEFKDISWRADVRWSPRTYSHIDFQTSREPVETLGDGDFMDTRVHRLTWQHDWNDSWQTRLGARIRNEDFVGTERQEQMTEWTFDLGYRIRRWLTIEIGAAQQSSDSSIESLEYDLTVYRLGVQFAP
jgi:hypothetical protein